MEDREETLGSSKVSLAAAHKKKKKSPVSNKMEGMHSNWDCSLTFTYIGHTHLNRMTYRKPVAENWNFFSTWTLCNKQHAQKRPPYTYLGEAGHESFERMSVFCSQVYSHSQKHYLFLTI